MSSIMPANDPVVAAEEPTFTLFPKLPLELRLMIWKELVPQGRLITIKGGIVKHEYFEGWHANAYPSNSEALNALFQACHDSRKMIQKTHTLSFHDRLTAPIYFDFKHDVLFFKDACSLGKFAPRASSQGPRVNEVRDLVKTVIGLVMLEGSISNLYSVTLFENLDTMIWEKSSGLSTRPSIKRLCVESVLEESWKRAQVDGKARTKIEDWSIDETKEQLCDERKPSCDKCIKHNIVCDFAVQNTAPGSSKDHLQAKPKRKFVASGYEAAETPPSSVTEAHSSPADVFSASHTPSNSHIPQLTTPGLINAGDLEIWHHYLMKTCPSFLGNGLEFWQEKVPEIGFSYHFVLQLILSLSAFHLARCQPEKRDFYLSVAEKYHTAGIQGATVALASLNAENCEAMYTSAILVCFCSFARGPQIGEFIAFSIHGEAQWFTLLRGVRSIAISQHEKIHSGILAPNTREDARKSTFEKPTQPLPDYKPPISELRWFINSNSEMLEPFSDIYLKALDTLLQSFNGVYATLEEYKENDDRHSQVVFAWLYRASEDYIRCLQEKQPIALIIFSFFAVLLQELNSQWFMEGWVRHVIEGIRGFVPQELQHWLRWPIEQTKYNPYTVDGIR
ncbi:hypothetical protein IFR05_011626 [Cadophora sp. M221]|nr:hypothetical protein IFR05_011626 [Cadophora sp. M221]